MSFDGETLSKRNKTLDELERLNEKVKPNVELTEEVEVVQSSYINPGKPIPMSGEMAMEEAVDVRQLLREQIDQTLKGSDGNNIGYHEGIDPLYFLLPGTTLETSTPRYRSLWDHIKKKKGKLNIERKIEMLEQDITTIFDNKGNIRDNHGRIVGEVHYK